jgi:hypothetical protein
MKILTLRFLPHELGTMLAEYLCFVRPVEVFFTDKFHYAGAADLNEFLWADYHWTLLRRPLRAKGPSIILCAKKWSLRAPQRRGSSHSGEGKNGRVQPITTERRGYKKIPLVGFQDLYKTDLQNSFRVNRVILRGFPAVVTQILGPILGFSLKVPGGILEFVLTSPGLEAPLLMFDVSYILASNRTHQDE